MNASTSLNRRDFTKTTLLAGAALASGAIRLRAADAPVEKIRTGLIGCGSVSNEYLPQLIKSPFVELGSQCDIKADRAKKQGERFKVANTYPNIDAMLAGGPFDFPVDTTNLQPHDGINRRARIVGHGKTHRSHLHIQVAHCAIRVLQPPLAKKAER